MMTRIALLLLLSSGAMAVWAQAPGTPPALPEALLPRIERLQADLEASAATPDAAARDAARARLDQARADDNEATRLAQELRSLRDAALRRGAELARMERELQEDAGTAFRRWRESLPERSRHEDLLRLLADERATAEQTGAEVATVQATLAALDARPAQISEALARARAQADPPRSPDPGTTSEPLLAAVEAVAAAAAQRRAIADWRLHLAEQEQLAEQKRWTEQQQRLLQRRLDQHDRRADVLEAMLAERSDAELGALATRLDGERATFDPATAAPAVIAAADLNVALGREIAASESRARASSDAARRAQRSASAAADSLRVTRTRLQLAGEDEAVGVILLSERRRLADPESISADLDATRRELARVQLRLLDLEAQRDMLDAPEQALEDSLRGIDLEDMEDEAVQRLRADLAVLLATRAELLPQLESAQRDLADALATLERALQEQLGVTTELVRILDRQLLWIPSHEPIGVAWLQRQIAAWADLFKPSRYATSARLLADTLRERWPLAALTLGLFLALLGLRRRIGPQLDALAQHLKRVRTDRFRYTARALLLSALAVLPWPLLLWVLGWMLQHAGSAGRFSDSLGQSVVALSGGVLLWQSLHWLTRERGLAHSHFRWTRARRAALRATLPWLAAGLLPLQFLLTLAFVRGQEPAVDAAARVMILGFCALGGWLGWRLLAPGAVWSPRGAATIEPSRLRQSIRLALPALLVALSLMALDGYVFTAGVMLRALWLSASAILAIGVLHGLIARWFLLGERRLALKRLEQRQREAESAAEESRSAASGDAMPEVEADEIAIESVNAQTRRLLRALIVTLLVGGLAWVWSDVLPALARLDDVVLWTSSTVDEAGKTVAEAVSLRAVLFGLVALVLTVIAARNLPGLVEIGLLSRIHLDAPTRYAITSLSRYFIVIGGVLLGLSLLGVRWSQLQWMAAALTVGLGFGLQEIFANFVSGLIVLFERPYRVGDVITIGEVEGTVTRIRTRATTVLDWDNREVVVPNKTFITERFINWTLSDAVTRVVIRVGVAYASDPDRVRELLLSIAKSEPLVIDTPPPTCWFTELGDSTLNFELRLFVAELLHRNQARTAVLQRIISEFREHGIEIAFPQMDLWVRNAAPDAPALEASTRKPG